MHTPKIAYGLTAASELSAYFDFETKNGLKKTGQSLGYRRASPARSKHGPAQQDY
jgi:hypothetical protein